MPCDELRIEESREWAIACDVQRGFMQGAIAGLETLDCSAECRQAHQLGGDCYDFTPLAANRVAVAVGDASGKGLAAALMISNVQSSLRTAAMFSGDDIATLVGVVNRQVHASSLADRYATLFYGIFDGDTRTLHYVNAGHNLPMIIRKNGSIEWLETGGAPVGMFPDWKYEERSVQLHSGDVLLAYTDGVTESVNPAGDEWGIEGLRRSAAEAEATCADEMVDAIFRAMYAFSGECQRDDATIVVVRAR